MRGFTLLELFIVIAITLVLVLASLPIYSNLMVKSQLKETSAQAVMTIRDARESALSGYRGSAYGVFLSMPTSGAHSYISYAGDSYAARNQTYDRVNTLEAVVAFANVNMTTTADGIDINFSKGLGKPNNTGNFNLVHSVQGVVNISINNLGKVEEN